MPVNLYKRMKRDQQIFDLISAEKDRQLHGLELQPYMFTIATTNMILRGDGKSNLEQEDFLKQNPAQLQERGCTVGMMNPPYSMGSKNNPSLYEINFTEHLLNSIIQDGKAIVIVPQSSMTGKTWQVKRLALRPARQCGFNGP